MVTMFRFISAISSCWDRAAVEQSILLRDILDTSCPAGTIVVVFDIGNTEKLVDLLFNKSSWKLLQHITYTNRMPTLGQYTKNVLEHLWLNWRVGDEEIQLTNSFRNRG